MDPRSLQQALLGSLSANASERHAAELALSGLDASPGYLPCLFAVITSGEVQPAVAQAGSIYLKNLVGKHWVNGQKIPGGGGRDARGMVVFPEEDKAAVRAGIFEALASSNNQTRGQLVNVLKKVAHYDFPGARPAIPDLAPSRCASAAVWGLFPIWPFNQGSSTLPRFPHQPRCPIFLPPRTNLATL